MGSPTEAQVRAQLVTMAAAALAATSPKTQVLDEWVLSYQPGDDMTVLRGGLAAGRVDTMMIWEQEIGQTESPHDASRYIRTPRGKKVVSRKYGTWLFNQSESALALKVEAWRLKCNAEPVLGFGPGVAEFIESVGALQVPVMDHFPTGDALTPVAYFAQGHLMVRVIEPQG
jgi:hypothetical protein